MKTPRILIRALAILLGSAGLHAAADITAMLGHEHHAPAPALTATQRQLLSGYETIRAALAADDLTRAKTAAAGLHDAPASVLLARADSLTTARIAFEQLTRQIVPLAKGQAGYYLAHCEMVDVYWVQTTTQISNPYYGTKMPTCGSIKNWPR